MKKETNKETETEMKNIPPATPKDIVPEKVLRDKTLAVKIPDNLHRRLRARCAMEGQTVQTFMEHLLKIALVDGEN